MTIYLLPKRIHLYKYNMNKMYFYVYKITNLINGKIYVGVHRSNKLENNYMGSGKLIKRAISKYGVENFSKEILKVFSSYQEAEQYEAAIVDREFVLDENTYNIALGGNVRAMVGKHNPFYGKKHSKDTIKRIQAKRSKTINERKFLRFKGRLVLDGRYYHGITEAIRQTRLTRTNILLKCGDISDRVSYFIDEEKQYYAELFSVSSLLRNAEKIKTLAKLCSERFKGVPKTEESNRKRSESLKKVPHYWQDKINKNPVKIAKTANFHRGRKRSEETRSKLSAAGKARTLNGYTPHNKLTYITPKGKFPDVTTAAKANGITTNAVRLRCVYNNHVNITNNMIKNQPDRNEIPIGSTFHELGWGVE